MYFIFERLAEILWSFPVLIGILAISIFVTAFLNFVQINYFMDAVRSVFSSPKADAHGAKSESLTSLQAFINTLGGNIGNGALAGIPTAIAMGGPGAIFWLLVMATFAGALRFAEVYLGMSIIGKHRFGSARGGPMVYLSLLPGGYYLSYIFGVFCLTYAFTSGSLVQCNAVGLAVKKAWGITPIWTALVILVFVLYVLFGGSERIVKVLDKIVPLKVFLLLVSVAVVLIYHHAMIPHALYLIFASAFTSKALVGGGIGHAVQKAMTVGFQRGIFAHEAGLGTAAVAYGNTSGAHPAKDAIMSTLGVFITVHVICFLVAMCVLVTGVWQNGESSSALIISAYETVFGRFAGIIITFLTINFGASVLISYAYIGRQCWEFLTNKHYLLLFSLFYAFGAALGTVMDVSLAWTLSDIVNAALFFVNMLGVLWFLPVIKKGLLDYKRG